MIFLDIIYEEHPWVVFTNTTSLLPYHDDI